MVSPVRAGLQRVERKAQVVDGARKRGEVEDDVDRLVDRDVLDDVVVEEDEGVVADVVEVRERPGLEVVEAQHPVAALEERLAEMRAEKACAAGDERGRHVLDASRGWARPPASHTTPRRDVLAARVGVRLSLTPSFG